MRSFKKLLNKFTIVVLVTIFSALLFSCKQSATSGYTEVTLNPGNVREANKGTQKVYYSDGKWYEDSGLTVGITKINIPSWTYEIRRLYQKSGTTDDLEVKSSSIAINGYDKDNSSADQALMTNSFQGYGDIIKFDGTFTGKAPKTTSYNANWLMSQTDAKITKPRSADLKIIGDNKEFKGYTLMTLKDNKTSSKDENKLSNYDKRISYDLEETLDETNNNQTIRITITDEITYLLVNSREAGSFTVFFKDSESTSTGNILYYVNADGSWRAKPNTEGIKESSVTVPEKKQTVIFQGNSTEWTNKTVEMKSKFEGYFFKNGNDWGRAYTDENGNLKALSEEELVADLASSGSGATRIEVFAKFVKGEGINLTGLDINGDKIYEPKKSGQRFRGWVRNNDASQTIIDTSVSFFPEESDGASVTLVAIWGDIDRNELTLDSNGATADYGFRTLYNVASGNSWFKEASGGNAIKSITVPEKEWTVNFVANWPNAKIQDSSVKYKHTFKGYYIPLDGNNKKEVINSVGSITSGALSASSHAKAEWTSEGFVINNPVTFDEDGKGVEFVGWSTTNGKVLVSDGKPEGIDLIQNNGRFTPEKDNVTLYGVWRDTRKYKLELLRVDDTDTGSDVKEIWYSVGQDKWYKDSSLSDEITISNSLTIPKRVWTVDYTANMEGVTLSLTDDHTKYEWVFGGYGDYVTDQGLIANNVKISKDERVTAKWEAPVRAITLPTETDGVHNQDTKVKLAGWKKTKSGDEIYSGEFIPDSDNVSFYGAWTDSRTVIINLRPSDAESSTRADLSVNWQGATPSQIFYSQNDGNWYSTYEADGTKTLYNSQAFTAPTKMVTIKFNPGTTGLPSGSNPVLLSGDITDQTITYEFLGFKGYIDKNGNLEEGVTATKADDGKYIDASWGESERSIIELPVYSFEGYTFSGWKEEGSTDRPTKKYVLGKTTKPTITLTPVWESLKKHTVTLNGNGATRGEKSYLYFREIDNAWLRNENDTNGITTLAMQNIPKRVWAVKFDKNGNTDAISLKDEEVTWTFLGYYDSPDGGEQYITKDGEILKSSIDRDVELYAHWEEKSDIVTITQLQNKIQGYKVYGWSVNSDAQAEDSTVIKGNAVEFTTSDGDMTSKTITLYLVWDYETVYTLTLRSYFDEASKSEAIYNFLEKQIYYRENDGWYSIREKSTDGKNGYVLKNRIESVSTPTKSKMITLDTKREISGDISTTIYASYPFLGYGQNGDTYNISSDGVIAKELSITRDQTIYATWDPLEATVLPSLTAKSGNYVFEGWSEDGKELSVSEMNAYIPEKKETKLEARWRSTDTPVVLLNANGGANLSKSLTRNRIYKNPNNGEWYYDEAFQSMVSGDLLAERKVRVVFNTNSSQYAVGNQITPLPDEEIRWEFKGYSISGKEFIDENGEIVGNISSLNETAYAIWGDIEEAIDLNERKLECEQYPNWKFVGWSTEYAKDKQVVLPKEYRPDWSDTYNGNNGKINLYAIWTDEKAYTIELDSNTEDTSVKNSTLVYRAKTEGYHTSLQDEDKITSVRKPTKSWRITYDTNLDKSDVINDDHIIFTFGGYEETTGTKFTKNGVAVKDVIDENGMFIDGVKPISTLDSGTVITLTAKWTTSTEVTLPETSRVGYKFEGWELHNSDGTTEAVGKGGEKYTINKKNVENNRITFYGKWSQNKVYTLTISDETATSKGYERIYYRENDGWYSEYDPQATSDKVKSAITRVLKPSRVWYISFESMLDGVANPTQKMSESVFGGIYETKTEGDNTVADLTKPIALGDGAIVKGATISANTNAIVVWAKSAIITVPTTSEMSKDGYSFVGWTPIVNGIDTNTATTEEFNTVMSPGAGFTPEYEKFNGQHGIEQKGTGSIKLYGVWRDNRIFKLTLEGNGATSSVHTSAVYYKPQTKKWYLDPNGEGEATTTIRAPEKEWKIRYNTTWTQNDAYGIESVDRVNNIDTPNDDTLTWTFGGYEAFITEKDTATSKDGDERWKVPEGGITSDRNVKAIWKEVNLTSDANNKLASENLSSARWTFNGWSEEPSSTATIVANPYRPFDGDTKTISDRAVQGGTRPLLQKDAASLGGTNYIVLYAHWRGAGSKKIAFNHNGATSGTTEAIYYSIEKDNWYSDDGLRNKIDRIDVPKKVWTIKFDSNGTSNETLSKEGDMSSEGKFLGYEITLKDGKTYTLINQDGSISTANRKVITDYLKAEDTNDNLESDANWDVMSQIELPSYLTRPGYTLSGWMLTPNGVETVGKDGFYTPEEGHIDKATNSVTLYASYRKNAVYKLTLDGNGATNVGLYTQALYYWVGKGWYREENPDTSSTILKAGEQAVTIPTWSINIKYELNTGTSTITPPSSFPANGEKIPRTFLGYTRQSASGNIGFISREGNLISTAILSEDLTLKASWGTAKSLKLPKGLSWEDHEFMGWSFSMEGGSSESGTFVKEIYTEYITLGEREKDWEQVKDNTVTFYAIWRSTRVFRVKLGTSGFYLDGQGNLTKNSVSSTSGGNAYIYYREADGDWYNDEVSADSRLNAVTIPQSIYTISYRTNNSAIAAPAEQSVSTTFKGYRFEGSQDLGGVEAGIWFNAQGVLDRTIATPAMKTMIEAGLRPTDVTSLVPLYDTRASITLPNLPSTEGGDKQEGGYVKDQLTGKGTKYYFYDWTTDANKTWSSTDDTDPTKKSIYKVQDTYTIRAANDVLYARIEDTTIYHVNINLNKGAIEWGRTGGRFGDAILQSDGTYSGSYLTSLSYKVSTDEWYANPIPYDVELTTTTGKPNGKNIAGQQPYESQRLTRNPIYLAALNANGTNNNNVQLPTRVDVIEYKPDYKLAMEHAEVKDPDSLWTLTTKTTTDYTDYDTTVTQYTPSALDLEEIPMKEDFTWQFGGYKFTAADGKTYTVFDEDMKFVLETSGANAYIPTGDFEITAEWNIPESSSLSLMLNNFPQLHLKATADSTDERPKGEIVTTKPTGTDPTTWLTYELSQRDLTTFKNNYYYVGPQSLSIKGWSNSWTDDPNNANVGLESDNRSGIDRLTYTPKSTTIKSTYYYNNDNQAMQGYRYTDTLYGTWSDVREYYFHLIADDEGIGGEAGVDDGFNYKFDEATQTISGKGLPIVVYSTYNDWTWFEYESEGDDKGLNEVSLVDTYNNTKFNADVDMPLANKNFVVSYDWNDTTDGTDHAYDGTLTDANTKAGANFLGYYFIKKDFLAKGFTESTLPWPTSVPSSAVEDRDKVLVDADGDFKLMTNDVNAIIDNKNKTVLGLYMLNYKPSKAWDNFTGYEDYTFKYESDETAAGVPIFSEETYKTIPVKAKWSQGSNTITLPTPTQTVKDGMTFQGWSASKTGEVGDADWRGKAGETYTPKKSEKLYAVWYENVELIVKYKGNVLKDTDTSNFARAISGVNFGEDDTTVTKQTGETFISDGKGIPIEVGLYKEGSNGTTLATKARFKVLNASGNIDTGLLSQAVTSYSSNALGGSNTQRLDYGEFSATKEQDGYVRRISFKVNGYAVPPSTPYTTFNNRMKSTSDYLQLVGNSGNQIITPSQYGSLFINILGKVEITPSYTVTADYSYQKKNADGTSSTVTVTKGTVLSPYGTVDNPFRNPSVGVYSNYRAVHYKIKNARFKNLASFAGFSYNDTATDGAKVESKYEYVSPTEITLNIRAVGYSSSNVTSEFNSIINNHSTYSAKLTLYGETVETSTLVKLNDKLPRPTRNLGLEQTLTTNVYATTDGDKDKKKFFDSTKPTTFYAYWQIISEDEDTLIPEFKEGFSETIARNIIAPVNGASSVSHGMTIDKIERLTPSEARKVTSTITEDNFVNESDSTHYNVLRYTVSNFYVMVNNIGSSSSISKSIIANTIDNTSYTGISSTGFYMSSSAISATILSGTLPDFSVGSTAHSGYKARGSNVSTESIGYGVAAGVEIEDLYVGISLSLNNKFDESKIGTVVTSWYKGSHIKGYTATLVDVVNDGKTAILQYVGARVDGSASGGPYADNITVANGYIKQSATSLTVTTSLYHTHSGLTVGVTLVTGSYTPNGTTTAVTLSSTGIVGPYMIKVPDFYMGFQISNGAKFKGNSGVGAIGTNITSRIGAVDDRYNRGTWTIDGYNSNRTIMYVKCSGSYITYPDFSSGSSTIALTHGSTTTLIPNYYGSNGTTTSGSLSLQLINYQNTAYGQTYGFDSSSSYVGGSETYPLKGDSTTVPTGTIRFTLKSAYTYNFTVGGDKLPVYNSTESISWDNSKAYFVHKGEFEKLNVDEEAYFKITDCNNTGSSKYIEMQAYNVVITSLFNKGTVNFYISGYAIEGDVMGCRSYGQNLFASSPSKMYIEQTTKVTASYITSDVEIDGVTYKPTTAFNGPTNAVLVDQYIGIRLTNAKFNTTSYPAGKAVTSKDFYSNSDVYNGDWSVVGYASNNTIMLLKAVGMKVTCSASGSGNAPAAETNLYKYIEDATSILNGIKISGSFSHNASSYQTVPIKVTAVDGVPTTTGEGRITGTKGERKEFTLTITLGNNTQFVDSITDDMVYDWFKYVVEEYLAQKGTYTPDVTYRLQERSSDGSSITLYVDTVIVNTGGTSVLDIPQDVIKLNGTSPSLKVTDPFLTVSSST